MGGWKGVCVGVGANLSLKLPNTSRSSVSEKDLLGGGGGVICNTCKYMGQGVNDHSTACAVQAQA